ncbi:mycothiol system anti-sigma-R factor [Nocardioides rubriscoriae]|uniref:mycothiol system anti-sigma-R factor n=1 Tax=Nocardioides rubriscoriae TaxID=642762 RepID=UPI0011DF3351|nr:mycothiol system anti-sigma-R factor [Nocardioides rubriscoriae]
MTHAHGEHADHAADAECADFLERIVYFLDNELDDADCADVRLHLDSCNPCLVKYDLQRTVKAVVARSCSEVAPADLRERVRVRIREVQVQIQVSPER